MPVRHLIVWKHDSIGRERERDKQQNEYSIRIFNC